MTIRVLVIGGYGNFGGYVARKLAPHPGIQLVIAGRDKGKAIGFANSLQTASPSEGAVLDIAEPLAAMAALEPDLVINMVGPYHTQDYAVVRAAIACGASYCDIADSRRFVTGIGVLDGMARDAGVAVLAGASSVPCLTAAYIDEAATVMEVHAVDYGISGAEQANRGVGTVSAVLSYVGERFARLRDGRMQEVVGWAGLHCVRYPELGRRWFANGDVPDLALFPERYPSLRNQRYSAGHEIALLHFGTWVLGRLRRFHLLPPLDRLAPVLLTASGAFNWLGRGRSAFHMFIDGVDAAGHPVRRKHWIIARSGDGPNIPCVPVILIARMLAEGRAIAPGARPCLGVITREEFHSGMKGLDHSVIDEV